MDTLAGYPHGQGVGRGRKSQARERGDMSTVGQREIRTQQRVIAFFRAALGYAYLGDWRDRADNGTIEKGLLTDRLMPQWRVYRDELNRAPLAHEDWHY